MAKEKRIGVLTSGGDCAGLNAALRAVTRRAAGGYGWTVIGIEKGAHGVLQDPPGVRELRPEDFDGTLVRQGGTILGSTNRGDPFAYPVPGGGTQDRSGEFAAGLQALNLDGLIGIGGDGSQAILKRLADLADIPLICIPKTIDNDVALTEVSIGYDTAVQVATEALDHLQPTAASHNRVMILEVMGRDAGHIAVAAGIAGGADVILIPEIPYDIDAVASRVADVREHGNNFALIVVSEAVPAPGGGRVTGGNAPGAAAYGGIGHVLAGHLEQRIEAEIRVTVLGHLQRGGIPTARDRLMASAFGVHAVDLLAAGARDRMVAWQNRRVVDVAIADAIAAPHIVDVDGPVMTTARGLGISFGDA